MIEYIEKMRARPEHVRRRFAFIVSFSFTAIIFLGWMASYGLKSSPVLADKSSKVDSPMSSMTASVIGIYGDIKSMIFGSNKVDYNSIEITAGKR